MPRPQLTALIATALASITVALATSYFGTAGTLWGGAITAVIGTLANTYYQHFMTTAGQAARRFRKLDGHDWRPQRKTVVTTLASIGAVIVAAAAGLTIIEAVAGRPAAAIVRPSSTARGFTISRPAPASSSPAPLPTPTVSQTQLATQLPTATVTPTFSPSPSFSPTPVLAPTPSPSSPSPSISAVPTPSLSTVPQTTQP
jgi:hypothetical protein